uniref:Small nuclear ribonucleoprotein E n=2 Tax=Oryza TaxID=4527 RepID=A0A0D3F050_9ORYZ
MASTKVQRIMTQPINLIFRFLQSVRALPSSQFFLLFLCPCCLCAFLDFSFRLLSSEQKARIQIWLFEQKDLRIEGRIIMYVNSVLYVVFIHNISWDRTDDKTVEDLILLTRELLFFTTTIIVVSVTLHVRAKGFDEYMNLVLDEAEEINIKKDTRKSLGRILLKGDNITLMMNTGK